MGGTLRCSDVRCRIIRALIRSRRLYRLSLLSLGIVPISVFSCHQTGLKAREHAKFAQDVCDVELDGPLMDLERVGNLSIVVTEAEKRQDLTLPLGQLGYVETLLHPPVCGSIPFSMALTRRSWLKSHDLLAGAI